MTAQRLQNIAFGFMIVAAFSVYSASKDQPMQTSKLFAALIIALLAYGFSSWAARKKSRENK